MLGEGRFIRIFVCTFVSKTIAARIRSPLNISPPGGSFWIALLLLPGRGTPAGARAWRRGVVEHRHPDVRTDSTINAYGENGIIAPFLPAQARLAPATTPAAAAHFPSLAYPSLQVKVGFGFISAQGGEIYRWPQPSRTFPITTGSQHEHTIHELPPPRSQHEHTNTVTH